MKNENTTRKSKAFRESTVAKLQEKLKGTSGVVLAQYQGLKAAQVSKFKLELKKENAEAVIAKNTLLNIALQNDSIKKDLKGSTLAVFLHGDPIAAIKAIVNFAKEHEDLPKAKAAVIEGSYIGPNKFEELSAIPGKNQLLAKLVGTLQSPISGIVNVLNGTQRNFVSVLSQIASKK